MERAQLRELISIRPFPVGARHFEDRGQLLQARIAEKRAQPVADQTLADVVVAIAVRSQRRLRVVRVQRSQPLEADAAVEVVEQRVERGWVGDVDTRDPEMTGVEADAEPLVPVECVEEDGELVERPSDRAAGAGRVLHQKPRALVAAVEDVLQGGDGALEGGVEPGAEM